MEKRTAVETVESRSFRSNVQRISSFLHHRVARVKLDGSLSREIRLSEGVPQGRVLSPTLFLLYVNDIVNTLPPRVTYSLHVDDLAAWASAEHTSTATHVMQETSTERVPGQMSGAWESTAAKHKQHSSHSLL